MFASQWSSAVYLERFHPVVTDRRGHSAITNEIPVIVVWYHVYHSSGYILYVTQLAMSRRGQMDSVGDLLRLDHFSTAVEIGHFRAHGLAASCFPGLGDYGSSFVSGQEDHSVGGSEHGSARRRLRRILRENNYLELTLIEPVHNCSEDPLGRSVSLACNGHGSSVEGVGREE